MKATISQADDRAPMLFSCRMTLSLMSFFGFLVLLLLRINMSLSIVCMVKSSTGTTTNSQNKTNTSQYFSATADDDENDTTADPNSLNIGFNQTGITLKFYNGSASKIAKTKYEGELEWSREFRTHILGSYYYGYIVIQFVAGWLSGRYGGKHVIGFGVLVAVVATFLIPAAARFNAYLVICLRIVLGAGSAVIAVGIQSLWGVWAPPLERSFLSAVSYFGATVGTVLSLLISSQFCDIRLDNGWPLTFYVTGGIGFIFWVLWNVLVFNYPDEHPRITKRELDYIQRCTGSQSTSEKRKSPFPWRSAVVSPAVIAIICASTASQWFTNTAIQTLPMYMKEVLKFDIKQNGLYMILPQLAVLVTTLPLAYMADELRRRQILSTVATRKLYQSLCGFGCSGLLIGLAFLDADNRVLAVVLLTLILPIQRLGRSGFQVNPQDIAPRFSGEISGIYLTFSTLSGIFAPMAVGILTPNGTQREWQTIFYISAALFSVSSIVFDVFAQGEVLSWAKPSDALTEKKPAVYENQCALGVGDEKIPYSAVTKF